MSGMETNKSGSLEKMAKNKSPLKSQAANKNDVRSSLEVLRSHKRRTVVWPAALIVNEFEFKSTLYDISLGGVRIKLDLPLATAAKVKIKIKDFEYTDALVSWQADGFIGLKFIEDKEQFKILLGEFVHSFV